MSVKRLFSGDVHDFRCVQGLPVLAQLTLSLVLVIFSASALAQNYDLSGDGEIDSADIGVLLVRWNTADADADFNSSGLVDNDDLDLLLSQYQSALPQIPNPVLDVPANASTTNNPFSITGSATAGQTIDLYVNEVLVRSITLASDSFSTTVPLDDHANAIHAVARQGALQSLPSPSIVITYQNNLPTMLSNPVISADAVWTQGSGASYEITGNLTIDSGFTLSLQPGSTLALESGGQLIVNGTLVIAGTEASPVVLGSASSVSGSWSGVVLNPGAALQLDYATIEYADTGITFNGGSATVGNSTLQSSGEGARINAGTPTLQTNLIQDNDNDGIYIGGNPGDAAVITGNTLINNGANGIHVAGASPQIQANTIESNFTNGVRFSGSAGQLASLVGNTVRNNLEHGLLIQSGAPIVDGNTVSDNQMSGIYVQGSAAAGTQLLNNTVASNVEKGLLIDSSAPQIQGNTIEHNQEQGIYLQGGTGTTPAISANTIRFNDLAGIHLLGNFVAGEGPQPIINNNQFIENGIGGATTVGQHLELESYDECCTPALTIDATNNWWGSSDVVAVENRIYHRVDDNSLAGVDYGNYLQTPTGSPASAVHLLEGSLANTTLAAGDMAYVLADVSVPNGVTLTIDAGARVLFSHEASENNATYHSLIVDGTLLVQGTGSAPVYFQSDQPDQYIGTEIWQGIVVNSGGSATFDHAIIEHAYTGIFYDGGSGAVNNSVVQFHTETGIHLVNASPAIDGNRIADNMTYGLFIGEGSNPLVTNNVITNNDIGIFIEEGSLPAVNPAPVINGNDIFNNVSFQLSTYISSGAVIDITGNWWGVDPPTVGIDIDADASYVDISGSTQQAIHSSLSSFSVTDALFSPNGDTVKDTAQFVGTLTASSSWTLHISNGVVSKTLSGSGANIVTSWDGTDNAMQAVADGLYSYSLSAGSPLRRLAYGFLSVDRSPPYAAIDSPLASAVLTSTQVLPVLGSTADIALTGYVLDYRASGSTGPWTTLNTVSSSTPILAGSLGSWPLDGSVALPVDGTFNLRVTATDEAGNSASHIVPVDVRLLLHTFTENINDTAPYLRPLDGEQLTVEFDVNSPVDVTLNIYHQLSNTLIGQVSQSYAAVGVRDSISWSGTFNGQHFDDGTYRFEIEAVGAFNAVTFTYFGVDLGGSPTPTHASSHAFDPSKNEVFAVPSEIDLISFGIQATRFELGAPVDIFMVEDDLMYPTGTQTLYWNGRDSQGALVAGDYEMDTIFNTNFFPNHFYIQGVTPSITGIEAPTITVTSNPWRVVQSFEQVSDMVYRLNQNAYVTAKLLPPGVTDFNSPQAIEMRDDSGQLVDNLYVTQLNGGSPNDLILRWQGYGASDTNAIVVLEEGIYTFAIQATGAVSNKTTLYRGALRVYR